MNELRISIRDTYRDTENLDDFYSNGSRYNGPRLLKIEWLETTAFPEMTANKIYTIEQFNSSAYDGYTIRMPVRYQPLGRDDPIIHELVHFLQHNTSDEDSRYVTFTGSNYREYLEQRVELEAHAVQVLHILRTNPAHVAKHLSSSEIALIKSSLDQLAEGKALSTAIPSLILCKDRQLI